MEVLDVREGECGCFVLRDRNPSNGSDDAVMKKKHRK
jgi:hypothetical protein